MAENDARLAYATDNAIAFPLQKIKASAIIRFLKRWAN